MVDESRLLPAPSATAWAVDLAHHDGPVFVVMRLDEHHAREALAEHLAEIGRVNMVAEARGLIEGSVAEQVVVVW